MNFEEAFKVAATAIFDKTGKHLNDAERQVLEGSWQGQTYEEMAKTYGYSDRYLKQDVGPKLWKLLSEALGQKVNKNNFRTVLELRSSSPVSKEHSQPQLIEVSLLQEPAKILGSNRTQDSDISIPQQLPESSELDIDTLYNVLLRLNFRDQVRLFRHFVETYKVGSCLIHGEPEYGQRWLLNRLVQLVPNGRSAKVIQFGLSRKSRANYIESLWRELGGRVGLPGQHHPPEIAQAVCKLWQTQTVILVFQNLDQMPQEYMSQFLCEFWLPLVDISGKCLPHSGSYRLLMLLVDYSGCVEQWKIDCVEVLDSTWKPQILVKLPRLNRLSNRDLENWMETGINDLPVKLTTQLECTVQSILKNSENGLPELALQQICSLCECNWYDWEQVWLKH
ncbi:MAG: hypothetical protein AB1589_27150 [Cyanobacteriota bacterium]